MRRRFIEIAGVLLILASTSGCATLAHGSREKVSIASTPPGAEIFVNGKRAEAVTPTTLSLSRRRGLTLRLERDGYVTQEVKVKRRGSRWLWLNLGVASNPLAIQGLSSASVWPLLILGVFSQLTAVDLISGAAFAVQKEIKVDLVAVDGILTNPAPVANR